MASGFACPECGQSITLRGLTPGREVICPACATLVEVPYLPRAADRPRRPDNPAGPPLRRGGRSRSWRSGMSLVARRRLGWGLAMGSVGLVALLTWWAVGSIGARARSDKERVLNELIAASDDATAAGNPGAAFREIEAAVVEARKIDPDGSPRFDALINRRNRAAVAEVAARLAALGKLGADARAGEARILSDRARLDPALAALVDPINEATEAALTNQVEADRDRARQSLAAGRGLEAFQAATRAHDRANHLSSRADSIRMQAEAQTILVDTVERFGAVVSDTPLVRPGADSLTDFARSLWIEALISRGYLLAPAGSPWANVWTAHAPYEVTARVSETREGLYLQSQNRLAQIDGQFVVTMRGQPRWQTRIYAQTRAPIPDLAAFVASRLATADHRDSEMERRLADDARTAFGLQAARNFRGIPIAGSSLNSPLKPPSS